MQMTVEKTGSVLIAISLVCVLSSCRIRQKELVFDERKEYEQVRQSIDNVIGWAGTKDFELFFSTIANDSSFISVTPGERVKFGFDEVKKDTAFWASQNFKAIRHDLRDLHIHFSHNKDVAWFFCYLDDINEWKGQPANWENVRWTGVLEKSNGKWIVVQQHFSFASE